MKDLEKYIERIKNLETLTQLPKIKNYINKFLLKDGCYKISKSIETTQLDKFCLGNNNDIMVILLSAFIVVLSKYVNNKILAFSIYEDTCLPFYKELKEETVSDLLKNIEDLLYKINMNSEELKDLANYVNKIIFAYNNKITKQTYSKLKKSNNELEIVFNVFTKKDNIIIDCLFDDNKIDKRLIKNFLNAYAIVLNSIMSVKSVKDIQYITEFDIKKYDNLNTTDILIDENNVPTLFKKQVDLNNEKTAVVSSKGNLTYDELNVLSNKLANILINNDIASEEIVTIILNRSIYSPVARQGILKAGGAFLNIIPDYPIERINYILEDCKSRLIITTNEIIKNRSDLFPNLDNKIVVTIEEILNYSNDTNPVVKIDSKQLCYCIYTSGSTGKPKGVMIEHRNILNYCKVNKYNREAALIVENINASLALATLTFDVSILEEFIPLLNGGTMVIANEEEIYNPIKLAKLIKDNKVEAITCTPSFLNSIIDIKETSIAFSEIKRFNIGAESFIPALYSKIKSINHTAEIYNGYGPTEATIGSTLKKIENDQSITIGLPMANIKTYITNSEMELLPVGIPGELIIAGNGVGRGYINNLEMTNEKFIKYKGLRAYKSGDLACINFDGEIDFVGRIDNQIKINGFRIELSEIEEVIGTYSDINRTFARVVDNNDEKFIVAYFTAKSKIDLTELKDFLKELLPYYMIPKFLFQIEEFPINNNGKVDLKKLPIPDISNQNVYVAPSNDFQIKLCEIFKKIIKKEKIGITDDFFEIGGKSLGVMKLIALASEYDIKIAYKDLFEYPTIEKLEIYLNTKKENNEIENVELDEFLKKFDVENEKINNIIKHNSLSYINELLTNNKIHNIAVSGSTGYLGMHVVYEYLNNYEGKIYCFVRKGKCDSIRSRFEEIYKYYFKNIPNDIYERIELIEGDITNIESLEKLSEYTIDTFINCAALVKYFDSQNLIEKVNVEGVKNIINYCKKNNVKLLQISTTSIGGTMKLNSNIKPFKEDVLFFGQGLENKYSKTKFLAEKEIINEIPNGLKAKIIRIGNLMPRYSDYQFQINYNDNGFLSLFKAFKYLKMVPESLLGDSIELSPVDGIAKTIFLLEKTNDDFNVYHSFNNNSIHYYDLIHAMIECGFDIKIVSNEDFENELNKKIVSDSKSEMLIGLFADLTASSTEKVVETEADNTFTTEVLHRLGYDWKNIDNEYLMNFFGKMIEKGYFD